MKKKVFFKWITALKSGNYSQCKKYLRTKDSYCALGVLCDISNLGTWESEKYTPEVYSYSIPNSNKMRQVSFLPEEVINWSGMSKNEYDILSAYVSILNDKEYSFVDIADAIKAKYIRAEKSKKKKQQNGS